MEIVVQQTLQLTIYCLQEITQTTHVQAVSRGTFNAKTGTWNLDSLNANSDAIIVFTVTAKKAGSIQRTLGKLHR